jgi:hypothetical protein
VESLSSLCSHITPKAIPLTKCMADPNPPMLPLPLLCPHFPVYKPHILPKPSLSPSPSISIAHLSSHSIISCTQIIHSPLFLLSIQSTYSLCVPLNLGCTEVLIILLLLLLRLMAARSFSQNPIKFLAWKDAIHLKRTHLQSLLLRNQLQYHLYH